MKHLALLPVSVLLLSMACSDDTDPDDHGSGNPATAPVDYLGAINQGKNKAVVDAALLQVNNALGQYQATNFKPAPSLQQLIDEDLLTTLPQIPDGAKWQYDPQTGKASVVPR